MPQFNVQLPVERLKAKSEGECLEFLIRILARAKVDQKYSIGKQSAPASTIPPLKQRLPKTQILTVEDRLAGKQLIKLKFKVDREPDLSRRCKGRRGSECRQRCESGSEVLVQTLHIWVVE